MRGGGGGEGRNRVDKDSGNFLKRQQEVNTNDPKRFGTQSSQLTQGKWNKPSFWN